MSARSAKSFDRIQSVHPHAWLWEPLESDATFVLRSMFGAKAAYLGGKLMLCFTASEEPWRGVLVCTEREHHASLRAEFPALIPHSILPKWLYLPEASSAFDRIAERLVALARQRDPRLGIIPKPRRKKSSVSRRRKNSRP
jgi:hypothetical protein